MFKQNQQGLLLKAKPSTYAKLSNCLWYELRRINLYLFFIFYFWMQLIYNSSTYIEQMSLFSISIVMYI